MLGVSLSSAARVRFERLKHRIRLYALSEIDECLKLRDDLVMMVCALASSYTLSVHQSEANRCAQSQNFNLIATKQSVSVERLTRVTLLYVRVSPDYSVSVSSAGPWKEA